MVKAALCKIAAARIAVFAAAATGVHSVLEIDEDFESLLLQIIDSLAHHREILFERSFERALHVEQARLDDDDGDGNAVLVADDELQVGPIFDFGRRGRANGRRVRGAGRRYRRIRARK